MKEIMIFVFMFISYGIPIIFIMKEITEIYEIICKIVELNVTEYESIDQRLKKLENKKTNNKEEK